MKIAHLVAISVFGFAVLQAARADAMCITMTGFCDYFDVNVAKGQGPLDKLLYGQRANYNCAGANTLATGNRVINNNADLTSNEPRQVVLYEFNFRKLLFSNYTWDGATWSPLQSDSPIEIFSTCPAAAGAGSDLSSSQ